MLLTLVACNAPVERLPEETTRYVVFDDDRCIERDVHIRGLAADPGAAERALAAELSALRALAAAMDGETIEYRWNCGQVMPTFDSTCHLPPVERPAPDDAAAVVVNDALRARPLTCEELEAFRAECELLGGTLDGVACGPPPPAPTPPPPPLVGATIPSRIDVRFTTDDVRGPLGRAAAIAAVREHVPDVRFCYEQLLATDLGAAGTIRVAIIVGVDGHVTTAVYAAERSTLRDERLGACIATASRAWIFPARPEGITGVNLDVTLASNGAAD